MTVFELTRALIDIDSVTPNEEAVGVYLSDHLRKLAARTNGRVERIEVEQHRYNVLAYWDKPVVTLSTHMDTVPPFFGSREDEEHIWGRGACDTKGIIAAMLLALEALVESGERRVAALFVVGEERNSAGAYAAANDARGSRFIINGEPTESKLALGSKGALRYEIAASGRMAHSAYPQLGESAIEKLLDALARIRKIPLPIDPVLGASTLNIGTIQGGRAPNVIPDDARAEIMIRLVDDGDSTRKAVLEAVGTSAEAREVLCIPAIQLESVEGLETSIVSFTTDIPAFQGAWGKPLLFGPGSIHVAHTSEERIPKRELAAAVETYQHLTRKLLSL
jgi:acetylornithine deacetylase